jgi:multidrug transporter EmrE-like cation transporter
VTGYGYVAVTVALTVYGQIVSKWRLTGVSRGPAPRVRFLVGLLADPWILSGMAAAALAGVTWLLALNEVELGIAYPFVAASFALVLPLSALLFGEPMTRNKVLGVGLVCIGLVVANVA